MVSESCLRAKKLGHRQKRNIVSELLRKLNSKTDAELEIEGK